MRAMRKLPRFIAVLTLSLLSTFPALGAEQDKLIDKALKSSGISGQVDGLAEAVLHSIPLDAFPDSKMKYESVSFLKESAAKESLVTFVKDAVREEVDQDSLEKVISFYDSRLGKRVGRAQEGALDPNVLKNIRESRALFASLSGSRASALQRIISAARVSQVNAILLQRTFEGLTEGYLSETQLSEHEAEAMRGQVKLMVEHIKADSTRSEETAQIAFAYTFKTLDDKEMEEFAKFSESEPAVSFHKAVQRGLEQAVSQTARVLGTAVARWRLQAEKPAPEKGKRRMRDDSDSRSPE
jgi:hypothetical protein